MKDTVREEMSKQEREIEKLKKTNDEYREIVHNLSAEMERLKRENKSVKNNNSGTSEYPVEASKSGEMTGMREEDVMSASDKLEVELARCKLDLVESQCKVQELEHSLGENVREINGLKNRSWLSRFNSTSSRNNSGD